MEDMHSAENQPNLSERFAWKDETLVVNIIGPLKLVLDQNRIFSGPRMEDKKILGREKND